MPVEAPVTSTALPARSGIEREAAGDGISACSLGGVAARQSYASEATSFK